MKKALKRILSILLTAIIITGSIPIVNFAETTTGTLKVQASGIYVKTAEVTNLPTPYNNGIYTAFCGNNKITINANHKYDNVTHGLYDGPNMRTMNYLFNTDSYYIEASQKNIILTHEQKQQVAWKILHSNDYTIVDTSAFIVWTTYFSGKVDSDFAAVPNENYNNVVFYANAGTTIQPIFVIVNKIVTVTFDTDGGSTAPDKQNLPTGSVAVKPVVDPTKTGYRFDYWMLNGSEYTFGTPVKSDITLVAHYTKLVTVTFDTAGGSTAPASQTFAIGLTATEPSDPTKEGYNFDRWTLNGTEFNFNTAVNNDITLVANYTAIPEPTPKVTVTFDTDGGSTAPASQTFDKGLTATEPAAPTKDGYNFVHWTLNGTEFNFNTAVNNDITLVAHYTAIPEPTPQVTVTFDTAGGSAAPASQTFDKGLTATEPAAPTKEGYNFDHWTLNGEAFNFNSAVNNDITLVAHYTEKTTEPPVESTEPPVESTEPPVAPTEPPVAPTEPQGPQGTVTVNHVSTEGVSLAPGFTFTGTIGTNYATSARTFEGYSLTEIPSNATGSFTSTAITITYVYSDNNIVVIEEEENALGAVDETVATEATTVEETSVDEPAVVIDEVVPLGDALPKTGQVSGELFYGIGGIITAVGVYLRRNKDK